jgi:hypothetical protein
MQVEAPIVSFQPQLLLLRIQVQMLKAALINLIALPFVSASTVMMLPLLE